MITESTVYWITRLDAIHNLLCLPIVICVAGIGIIAICQVILRDPIFADSAEDEKRNSKIANRLLFRGTPLCVVVLLLLASVKTFIPTTKEMCAIKVIPGIVNNEKIQTVGGEIYNVAREWLGELRPAKTE